jgi:hypothetical protein
MNPLPPMSVTLPKEPNTILVPTSNMSNERIDINVPQLISGHITSNGSSHIPTIISENGNPVGSSSNCILGSQGQTVNLMRRTPPNANLLTTNTSAVNKHLPVFSRNMIPNNTSDVSPVKMPKLQSILSTSLPSRGIPTVISMNQDQTSPPLPPLQHTISLSNKTSNNIPLPMEVVSKLTCSLPSSVSNANSAINGSNGMLLTQAQQHRIHQIPSCNNTKSRLLSSSVDIAAEAAEAAAEVMEQSAKNVLENEEVMWGAPHGGPAVVVEIADTVPVTYIEANGEIMETKYEMSINGVGGNSSSIGGGGAVTALDHMDYDYLCSVTQNNDHQIHQRQLDFCML